VRFIWHGEIASTADHKSTANDSGAMPIRVAKRISPCPLVTVRESAEKGVSGMKSRERVTASSFPKVGIRNREFRIAGA
jgi:hypothetical protein